MTDDARGGRVGRKVDRVLSSPAESSCTELQVWGREGRRRGSDGLKKAKDSGFRNGEADAEYPGEDCSSYLYDPEGL